MIEDVIAQSQTLVDSLTFADGTIALSALRTIHDTPSQTGAFSQLLGIKYEAISDGSCVATMVIKEHLLNPLGIAHGGVTYSLADSASGGAALSALGAPGIVTQDMQIRYHGPVRPGKIIAQAEVIHFGQRTITVLCQVNQEEVLVASTTATFAILSEDELSVVMEKS